MGWRFYRVWSTDWFRNKSVEKAFKNVPRKTEQSTASEVSFEETVMEKHFKFPKYQMADELSISRRMNYDIIRVTRAILEIESPLSEEWLLKRIVFLFDGREKRKRIKILLTF